MEIEEAGGGGDAAVPGVGLLHRVAVLQGVDAHPGLIWGQNRTIAAHTGSGGSSDAGIWSCERRHIRADNVPVGRVGSIHCCL